MNSSQQVAYHIPEHAYDFDRYMTREQFFAAIAAKVGVLVETVKNTFEKTQKIYDWGFNCKDVDTGVRAYRKARNRIKINKGKEKVRLNTVQKIVTLFKSIDTNLINTYKSSCMDSYIAELDFDGRNYKSVGKTKDLAIFSVRKKIAIESASGDWISAHYTDDLSETMNKVLKDVDKKQKAENRKK